ncbi:MAG: PspC domain-containing protein [Kiritimatiellae bacterium]|nr:PspC domain-containing protein [Kiritimatiellia bacterium]
MKRLCKSQANRVICGVCGGIGEYLDVDPTVVRLVFVLVSIFAGSGLLVYLIAALVMPAAGAGEGR